MDESFINHLEDIHDLLREFKSFDVGAENEQLKNTIEWLSEYLAQDAIVQLRRKLQNAIGMINEREAKLVDTKRQLEFAKNGIESLKHLQKYEDMAKVESDNIGHQAEVNMLWEKIKELEGDLATALRDQDTVSGNG